MKPKENSAMATQRSAIESLARPQRPATAPPSPLPPTPLGTVRLWNCEAVDHRTTENCAPNRAKIKKKNPRL